MKFKSIFVLALVLGLGFGSWVSAATTKSPASPPPVVAGQKTIESLSVQIDLLMKNVSELSYKVDMLNGFLMSQQRPNVPVATNQPVVSVLPVATVGPAVSGNPQSGMTPAQCLTSQGKSWPSEGGVLPSSMNDALMLCGKFWSQPATFTEPLKAACMAFSTPTCMPQGMMPMGPVMPGNTSGVPNFPAFSATQKTCLTNQGIPDQVISDMNAARQGTMISDPARMQAMQQWSQQASRCMSVSEAPSRGSFFGAIIKALIGR